MDSNVNLSIAEVVYMNIHYRSAPFFSSVIRTGLVAWLFSLVSVSALGQLPEASGPSAPAPAKTATPDSSAAPTKPQETWLTPEQIQLRITQLEQDKSLDGEVQKKAVELLKEALATANLSQQQDLRIQRLIQQREEAPKLIETLRAQLAEPTAEPAIKISDDAAISDYEQALAKAKSQFAEVRKAAEDLESRLKSRADRRTQIEKSAAQAADDLTKIQGDQETPTDEPVEIARGKRIVLAARRMFLGKQQQAAQEELAGFDLATDLMTLQRDQAVRQQSQTEKAVNLWQTAVNARKAKDADLAAQKARLATQRAAQSHPAVARLAKQNEDLAQMRTGPEGLTRKSEALAAQIKAADAMHEQIKADFTRVRERADTAGDNTAISLYLLGKRASLPDTRPMQQDIRSRQALVTDTHFKWIELQDQRSKLADPEQSLKEAMAEIGQEIGSEERLDIEGEMRSLLQSRAGFLDALIREYQSYLANLSSLDIRQRQLTQMIDQFRQYINERIMWVKSTQELNRNTILHSVDAGRWLFHPDNWRTTGSVFRQGLVARPAAVFLMVAVWGLLLGYGGKIRRALKSEIAQPAVKRGVVIHTLITLWKIGLMALSRPYLLWMVQWILAQSPLAGPFTNAVAAGLMKTTVAYLILEILRGLLLPGSLEQEQLAWSREVRWFLRQNLRWLATIVLITVFLQTVLDNQSNEAWKDSLGRLAFILHTTAMAAFLAVALNPRGILMRQYLGIGKRNVLQRLWYIWYPGAIALPGSLGVISGLGYFYTANELYLRVLETLLLAVLAAVTGLIGSNWLSMARRVLAEEEIRRRKQAAEEAAEKSAVSPIQTGIVPFEAIYRISQQSRRIVQAFLWLGLALGMWWIWRDVLPALGVVDRVTLWETTVKIGETTDTAGKIIAQTRIERVTLGDALVALVVVMMTLITARNVPGLMEMSVLQRMGVDRGVRFAITTLSRYLIVVVGVVMAFGKIGISWSRVQWLVAAMTVGLGFGLQEIFANFVSGLIILFERPMRVGDIVTAGDITGQVAQIHIRATTIRTWDNKELIVPNKEFITGRLMNWTLSEPKLRITFPVGVAYGSDTARVEQTLYRVAAEHPDVLKDPAPIVAFMNFGASSLDFELRVMIPCIDVMMKVRHAINLAIDREFRKEGIEIAFPQQDIHIRSIQATIPIETKNAAR